MSRILRSTVAIQSMENRFEHGRRKGNNMNSRNTQPVTRPDIELAIQEQPNRLSLVRFPRRRTSERRLVLAEIPPRLRLARTEAAAHGRQSLRASRSTHGMCPECFARVSGEIISHGETDLRVSVTKAGHQGGASLPAPPARNCAVPAWLQRPSAGDTDTTRPAVLRGKNF